MKLVIESFRLPLLFHTMVSDVEMWCLCIYMHMFLYSGSTLHLQRARGQCSFGSVKQVLRKESPYHSPLRKTSRHECPFLQTGCCVASRILLSCSRLRSLLVLSTKQTLADVPFTGLSESAFLMSAAVSISCPSLQYHRMHVSIGHKI